MGRLQMNERITELARQCASEDHLTIYNSNYARFAELIVRECIRCLQPLSRNHSMVGAAQDTIREHFNLE